MRKMLIAAGLGAALAAASALNAHAQTKPDVLVKQRQAAMVLQAKYFGPLGGMAAGRIPFDASLVARNAGYLEVLTKLAWDGFDASTSAEKSRALPEIHQDPAKFKAASDALQADVARLVAATKEGNEAATKAAIGAVGQHCGSCHDAFRTR